MPMGRGLTQARPEHGAKDVVSGTMLYVDSMLALGVLLSASSQLRASSLPVGPGEILLGAWVFCMLVREASRGGPPITRPLCAILGFWAVFWLTQSVGLINALALREEHDTSLLIHDLVALALVCAVSCLALADSDAGIRLRRTAWLTCIFAAVFLTLQLVTALPVLEGVGFDVWYWDRFRGWSENPNQLSLLCSVLVLICFYLFETSPQESGKIAATVLVVFPTLTGFMTLSNSFRVVLVSSSLVIAVLTIGRWLTIRSERLSFRSLAAWITVGLAPALALSLMLATSGPGGDSKTIATEFSRGNDATADEAALRFDLWTTAWERSLDASLVGLGPGPHIPPPPRFVAYMKRAHGGGPDRLGTMPTVGTAPNFESHNTFLELLLQGGHLLLCAYLVLLTGMVAANARAGCVTLAALVTSLAIYGAFHVILRNPVVWFGFVLALTALADRANSIARTMRRPVFPI